MKLHEIQRQVKAGEYFYIRSMPKSREKRMTFYQIEQALLAGEILEQYPDTYIELPRVAYG